MRYGQRGSGRRRVAHHARLFSSLVAVASLLSACATARSDDEARDPWCTRHPVACELGGKFLLGAAVIGLAIWLGEHNAPHGCDGQGPECSEDPQPPLPPLPLCHSPLAPEEVPGVTCQKL